MAKILIIGCGAIAYRHLQSLSIEKYADRHNTSLFLFDKYKSADELVKTFGSFCIDTRVILEENIYQYDFDIVIVCSSAGTRDAIDYSKLQTDFVLIEKPIANSIVELENLNFDDRCYVHLPFRSFRVVNEFRKTTDELNITVNGMNFGLMCNIWHFYDLITYINKSMPKQFMWSNCNRIKSKRVGFDDITGCLEINFDDGNKLSVHDTMPHQLVRKTNTFREYRIDQFLFSDKNIIYENGNLIDCEDNSGRYEYVSEFPSILKYRDQARFVPIKNIYRQTRILLESVDENFGSPIFHT